MKATKRSSRGPRAPRPVFPRCGADALKVEAEQLSECGSLWGSDRGLWLKTMEWILGEGEEVSVRS